MRDLHNQAAAIVNKVSAGGQAIVITSRGRPVAKLVPLWYGETPGTAGGGEDPD